MSLTIVVVLVAIAGLIGWRVVVARNKKRSLSILAATRDAAMSLSSYRAALPEVPDAFRTDIYTLVQGPLPVQGFPIQPTNSLWALYQLDQGTLESTIENHFKDRGILLPATGSGAAIETVQNVVRMLYTQATSGSKSMTSVAGV